MKASALLKVSEANLRRDSKTERDTTLILDMPELSATSRKRGERDGREIA